MTTNKSNISFGLYLDIAMKYVCKVKVLKISHNVGLTYGLLYLPNAVKYVRMGHVLIVNTKD